ncbi:hypothetical protein [Pectobacterium versatile]|uniref:hypothetical protein n=1 Tax=Pectobacterium versatile TaxID=2488639 RepID=UPI001CCC741B|nr:hypothetical protein [Pectobacterium versatile]
MNINGAGSSSKPYAINDTSINNGGTSRQVSVFSQNIGKVQQSADVFKKGHHRNNAVDLRPVSSAELVDNLGSSVRIKR